MSAIFAVTIVVFILVTLTNIGLFYEHRCVGTDLGHENRWVITARRT